jgi:CHRD domain
MHSNHFSWFFASASSVTLSAMLSGCGGNGSTGAAPDGGTPSPTSDAASWRMESGSASGDDTGTSSGDDAWTTTPDASSDAGPSTDDASSEAGGTIAYAATLDGFQETPALTSPATGTGTFTLSADKTTLTYHITHTVTGGSAAHIHLGAAGVAGSIIFPLTPFSADMTGTIALSSAGAAGPSPQSLVDALDKGLLYVNIHSAANPGGEVRGQILSPGDTLYVATLTGAQETPPVTSMGAGHATVILNSTLTSIKYHLDTSLTPTNAHIHKAIGSIAGPIVFPLMPLGQTIDGSAMIKDVDAADLAAGRLYTNVHTAAHPMGEIRGQLLRAGQVFYTAAMSPANEVPPVVGSAATGGAQFILGSDKTSLVYEVVLNGITPTAAHIHSGPVGMNGPVVYPLMLGAPGAKGMLTVNAADVTALDNSLYYCNAHTMANPTGEIRGQIAKQ